MTPTKTLLRTLARKVAAPGLLVLALAGCGRVGSLQQPGPLFGPDARADSDARAAARDADKNQTAGRRTVPAADQSDPNSDNAPKTRRDVQAPEQQNTPVTQDPIPGNNDIVGPQPSMRPPGDH